MQKNLDSKARRAERHALMTQQHGEAIEALGKTLQQHCCLTIADYGDQIEEYGQLTQYYAQQSLIYALLMPQQGLCSTGLSIEALQARCWAVKALVQANNVYLEATKTYAECRKLAAYRQSPLCGNCSSLTAELQIATISSAQESLIDSTT